MLVARAAIRRQWRGLIVVALLVGIAGGVVLAAAAGARRTSTSLDRFRSYSRSADVELDVASATPGQIAALRNTPTVASVGVLHQFVLTLPDGADLPSAAAVDATFGTVVDRARVVAGRLPRPTSATELAIGESFASQQHLHVGDKLTLLSASIAQTKLAFSGGNPGPPDGPKVTFRIVGLVRRPLDLGVRGGFGGVLVPTPAFYRRYRDEIGNFFEDVFRVRTQRGVADVPATIAAARRIFGDGLFQAQSLASETSGAGDAIDVLAVALWIFAGVAALAGATAVGIVTIRQITGEQRDQTMLKTLGLTARQRALAAGFPAIPAALGGGVLAVVVAAASSPLLPFGIARRAEVDPGFRLDGLVLGTGFVAAVAFVALVAAGAAWRVAGSPARNRRWTVARPSAAARLAEQAGARPALTTGLRMALEPGRGPTAVPVRSAFLGSALGALGIVAVLVFSGSLDHLVASPHLYGWPWDTVVSIDEPFQPAATGVCGDITNDVVRDRTFVAIASICLENVEVDHRPVTAWGVTPLRGTIEPTIVTGRAPRNRDEIVLGGATLDALGKKVGDTVRVRGPSATGRFRVVGQVVFASLADDDPEPLADGAALTGRGLRRLAVPEPSPNLSVVARFAPGVAAGRLPETGDGRFKFTNAFGIHPILPAEIDRIRQVDGLPAILAGILGLLAAVAVGHAVVLAVRRRRRELAVLRTIGFRRRDVRASLAYQSTILAGLGLVLGIPAGIAVGRVIWRAVADGLGVTAVFDVSVPVVVLVGVGALLLANLIGAIAAAAAIRERPATVLASE